MAYKSVTTSDKTCIYTLADPRTGSIRYIGKANNPYSRLNRHMNESSICKRASWIKGLKNIGLKPIVEVLEEVDKKDWQPTEMYWIAQFKAWGFDLVNMCEGGFGQKEGNIPWNKGKTGVYSNDQLTRMSKTQINRLSNVNNVHYFKLNPEKNLEIIHKFKSGKLVKDIAKEYSVTPERIYDLLKLNNCRAKDRPSHVDYLDSLIVSRFFTSFNTVKEIAETFDVNVCVVSKALKNNNISAKKLRGRLIHYKK